MAPSSPPWPSAGSSWAVLQLSDALPHHPQGAGDLDGNGVVDLYGWEWRSNPGVGWVSLGVGDGTFVHRDGWLGTEAVYSGYVMTFPYRARDLTGDGVEDLLVSEYPCKSDGCDTAHHLFPGDGRGRGRFAEPECLFTIGQASNALDLLHADSDGIYDGLFGLDDDGDAGQAWLVRRVTQAPQHLEEVFDLAPYHESGASDLPGAGGVRSFDWDGDGVAEVLVQWATVGTSNPFRIDLYEHDGSGTFTLDHTVVEEFDDRGLGALLAVPVLLDGG